MIKDVLFSQLEEQLEKELHFLGDKPEENAKSTLSALWHMASGNPMSAEKAISTELPALTDEQKIYLKELVQKRINNTPLAHITSRQNFMGIELKTDSRALIPRKETELLGNEAVRISRELIKNRESELQVIDTCCGCGNLGIAIAKNIPLSHIYACDLSDEALELTKENIEFHSLESQINIRKSDVLSAFLNSELEGKIDLIVCNPPYITSMKVKEMDKEIANYEPSLAFDGGMLGIKVMQKLPREASRILKPGGHLIMEIGLGQGSFIQQIIEKTNLYSQINTYSDSNGNIRVVGAIK